MTLEEHGDRVGFDHGNLTAFHVAQAQARALWDEVDARSDLWAVGATMYNLLTGRLPHDLTYDERAAHSTR